MNLPHGQTWPGRGQTERQAAVCFARGRQQGRGTVSGCLLGEGKRKRRVIE